MRSLALQLHFRATSTPVTLRIWILVQFWQETRQMPASVLVFLREMVPRVMGWARAGWHARTHVMVKYPVLADMHVLF
jgi:hypothetical protein